MSVQHNAEETAEGCTEAEMLRSAFDDMANIHKAGETKVRLGRK